MIQFDTIQDAIAAIMHDFGATVLKDTPRFIAILSDYAPNLREAQLRIRAFARVGGISALIERISNNSDYCIILESICIFTVRASNNFDDQLKMVSIIKPLMNVLSPKTLNAPEPFDVFTKGLEYYRRFPKQENIPISLLLFEEAFQTGNIEALLYLSSSFLKGKGVDQDIEKGIWYLSLAVEKQNSKAIIELADYYRKGIYVDKNIPLAISLLKKTSEPNAMYLLGEIYRDNYEYDTAFKYNLIAAEGNNVYAQYNTALAYAIGQGIKRDVQEAKRWLRSAASLGHSDARRKLEELGEKWD